SGAIPARSQFAPTGGHAREILEISQQPLDVFELELRAEVLAEAPAQFFQNAPRALHVDLARHLDRRVVAVVAPTQGPAERVGLLLGPWRPEPAGLAVRAGTQHALLLHRLGEVLRAAAQSFERAALGIDRTARVAFSKLTFRLAHGVAGAAELIHLALPLLALTEALLAQLLHQFLELIAQCLLILAQLAHLVALLPLLTLLALLAALSALAVAPLVLALLERAVAQLLLLADHVAELVERALLLHRLGEVLRAAAQSFERAALGIDRTARVAFSKLTFRLAHGVAGAAELIHLALPLLALTEALLAQLLHQFLELIAQCLLILAQLAHLVALLALLTLLALLAALSALAVAPLLLALLERAVAQLLLLADHVAELVERALLLHRLGEVLRAAAQTLQRALLGIDRTARVAFSKLTFRLA